MRPLLLIAAILLTGCASVPMAPQAEDERAKNFSAPNDEAVIYVFRDSNLGTAVTLPLWLDGEMSGALATNTFFRWPVAPGEHKVSSHMQNYDQIELTTEAGKSYFVRIEPLMGWAQPRVQFEQLPPDEAQPIVAKLGLAKDQR